MKKFIKTLSNNLRWILGILSFFVVIGIILAILKFFGSSPKFTKELPNVVDLVTEITLLVAFISSLAAIAIVCVVYSQIRPIKKTMKMEFIRHLDEKWLSPEITKVRTELWGMYWKELEDVRVKKDAQMTVQKDVQNLYVEAKRNPLGVTEKGSSENNAEKFFRYLNFVDLMGTIYIYKENSVLKEQDINRLFAGRIQEYLEFYTKYFEGLPKGEKTSLTLLVFLMT